MVKLVRVLCVVALLLVAVPSSAQAGGGPDGVEVLVVVPNYYGANLYLSIDDFESFGWNVTLAGMRDVMSPCPAFAQPNDCPPLQTDMLLTEIEDVSAYDVLALMPSRSDVTLDPYGEILEDPALLDLIAEAVDAGLVVFAPCAGTRVLAAAGVIDGKQVTGNTVFYDEYVAAGGVFVANNPPPVIDGNLVTVVRGLYYHEENSNAVAIALEAVQPESTRDPIPVSTQSDTIAQDGALWTRTFGGPAADGANAVRATPDGGLVLVGYTFSFGAGHADVYLVKTDGNGDEEWSRTFGGTGWDYGFDVVPTPDGGYIIAGYTTSFGRGARDVYLIKTDASGNEEWSQTFGGAGVDEARAVALTPDGGFLVTGTTFSFEAAESDIYVIKTDAEGTEEWSHLAGGDGPDVGLSASVMTDGSYQVLGTTGGGFGANNRDILTLRLDPDGSERWHQAYGTFSSRHPYDWGNAVVAAPDGGYVVIGDSDVGDGLMAMYVLRSTADGERVWSNNFGAGLYTYGNALAATDSGGYVLNGATRYPATARNDLYAVSVDGDGQLVWEQQFGADGSEWGTAVAQTPTGEVMLAGQTNSYGAGSFDMWLVALAPAE
ncbi:MAG: hypothetical protein GYB65_20510 [Chloroflexi bacterium]|nr:hypothetical protein [Chloroflexota bacterium]